MLIGIAPGSPERCASLPGPSQNPAVLRPAPAPHWCNVVRKNLPLSLAEVIVEAFEYSSPGVSSKEPGSIISSEQDFHLDSNSQSIARLLAPRAFAIYPRSGCASPTAGRSW